MLGNNAGGQTHRAALADQGFAHIPGGFATVEEAFGEARALVDPLVPADALAPLCVLGDFVVPPPDTTSDRRTGAAERASLGSYASASSATRI